LPNDRQQCRRHGQDIAASWQDGAPCKAISSYSPASGLSHSEGDLELFKTFTTSIEAVRDQKMAKALGASLSRQGRSLPPSGGAAGFSNMADNLQSVRELFSRRLRASGADDSLA
jgi:hypothetical protein